MVNRNELQCSFQRLHKTQYGTCSITGLSYDRFITLLRSGRMLGHLYAAEALVLLDKISDAIEHLNPEHVKELTLMSPCPEKDVDREKSDIGTEQQKPLRGEAESNLEYYSLL